MFDYLAEEDVVPMICTMCGHRMMEQILMDGTRCPECGEGVLTMAPDS